MAFSVLVLLCARPAARGVLHNSRSPSTSGLLAVVLVTAGIVLGILAGLADDGALHALWLGISWPACCAAIVCWPSLCLGWRWKTALVAGALLCIPFAVGYQPAWLQNVLVVLVALGAAGLISLAGGVRLCVGVLLALTGADLILWQSGMLEQVALAALKETSYHPFGSISAGDWQLGAGDLLASALVGTYASTRTRLLARLMVGSIQAGGLVLLVWLVDRSGEPLPATLPSLLALGTAFCLQHRAAGCRPDKTERDQGTPR